MCSQKADGFRRSFYSLGTISNDAESKSSHGNFSIVLIFAVCHDTGQFGNFSQPAAISLSLKNDPE